MQGGNVTPAPLISYFLFLISYFLIPISYFLFLISYFVFCRMRFLFPVCSSCVLCGEVTLPRLPLLEGREVGLPAGGSDVPPAICWPLAHPAAHMHHVHHSTGCICTSCWCMHQTNRPACVSIQASFCCTLALSRFSIYPRHMLATSSPCGTHAPCAPNPTGCTCRLTRVHAPNTPSSLCYRPSSQTPSQSLVYSGSCSPCCTHAPCAPVADPATSCICTTSTLVQKHACTKSTVQPAFSSKPRSASLFV